MPRIRQAVRAHGPERGNASPLPTPISPEVHARQVEGTRRVNPGILRGEATRGAVGATGQVGPGDTAVSGAPHPLLVLRHPDDRAAPVDLPHCTRPPGEGSHGEGGEAWLPG
jgi:hypothetical protein